MEKGEPQLNKEKTLLGYNKPMEVDSHSHSPPKNRQSPRRIPPVYDGSQLLVFGLFKEDIPKGATISAKSPDGPLSIKVEVS